MHLKSREIAVTGLIMAMGVVLIILGGYINTATLFFLAASAFLAGVIERSHSLGLGIIYLAGAVILGLLLSPQKLHIATFAAMGVYVLTAEWFEKRRFSEKKPVKVSVAWGIKFLVFHVIYLSALVVFEALFGLQSVFEDGILGALFGKSRVLSYVLLIVLGEVLWLVFDRAYLFFQRTYGHIFQIKI